jgi:hypothetical protein
MEHFRAFVHMMKSSNWTLHYICILKALQGLEGAEWCFWIESPVQNVDGDYTVSDTFC